MDTSEPKETNCLNERISVRQVDRVSWRLTAIGPFNTPGSGRVGVWDSDGHGDLPLCGGTPTCHALPASSRRRLRIPKLLGWRGPCLVFVGMSGSRSVIRLQMCIRYTSLSMVGIYSKLSCIIKIYTCCARECDTRTRPYRTSTGQGTRKSSTTTSVTSKFLCLSIFTKGVTSPPEP